MKFIDLFAGLGGFHLAAREQGGECVFACESDERLRTLYSKNFGMEPAGDINQLSLDEIPEHDLLCAGFPCQPFSKAGHQKGWKDQERGRLFGRIVDILKKRSPEFVILENVAHFVNHDKGSTYSKVESSLKELDYGLEKRMLSPHQFGVPHSRERLFVVARHGGIDGFEWPQPTTRGTELRLRDVLDRFPQEAPQLSDQVTRCLEIWQEFLERIPAKAKLPSFPIWAMEFGATYTYDRDSLREVPLAKLRASLGPFGEPLKLLSRQEIMARLPSHARREGIAFPAWKKDFIRQNREFFQEHRGRLQGWLPRVREFPPSLQKLEWNCQGEERDIWKYVLQFRASGVRVKRPTTAPSLVAMTTSQIPIIAWERRYMTALECARLQSMDTLEHLPSGPASIEAFGNAVNVKVVSLVLQRLLGTQGSSRDGYEGVSPIKVSHSA